MANSENHLTMFTLRPGPLTGRVIALSVASVALLAINLLADTILSLAFKNYQSPLPSTLGLGMFVALASSYILFLRRFPTITHKIAYLIVISLFLPVVFVSVGFMTVYATDFSTFLFYDLTCKGGPRICGSAFAFSVFTEAIRLLPAVILSPLVYLYALRGMHVQTFLHKPEGPVSTTVSEDVYKTDITSQLLMDAPQDTLNSGIAYTTLVALTASLLAMEDLEAKVAFSYGFITILITLIITIIGQWQLRRTLSTRYKILTYQAMMIIFDLGLAVAPLAVLLANATGQETPDTSSVIAIMAFIAFVSLPISTRLLGSMLFGKLLIFGVGSYFILVQSDFAFGSASLVILQLVALLLITALGFYFHIRNMGEISLRISLAELQQQTAAQNKKLEISIQTEKKTARRLEGEMELRRRLMRFVGHDFRQPINAISLMIFRMKRDKISSTTTEILDKCEDCVKSANGMIESLLDLSLLDRNARQTELHLVPAADILEGLRAEFETEAERRNVSLVIINSSSRLEADKNVILRILRNYVSNAMRYASGGRILVGVRHRRAVAEFQVIDEGPGISDNLKEKIFEEFFQADTTMPAAGDGLGLGLAITRELARTINSHVTFDSHIGKGSVFGVCVPLSKQSVTAHVPPTRQEKESASAEIASPSKTQPEHLQETKKRHILILDDDEKFSHAMAGICKDSGNNVVIYNGPFDDHKIITQQIKRADFILLDYNLGNGMTGPMLAQTHGIAPTGAVFIITAEPDLALLDRLQAKGWRVLRKPVSGKALATLLGELS